MTQDRQNGPWREPSEESIGIYPGLVVCDGRQSGSITFGRTRLPVWCVIPLAVDMAFAEAAEDYGAGEDTHGGWTPEMAAAFISDLLELRGDFGRLILELAAAERAERRGGVRAPWWQRPGRRRKVRKALERCIAVLDNEDALDAGRTNGS